MSSLRAVYQRILPSSWRGSFWHFRRRLGQKWAKHVSHPAHVLRDFFLPDDDWHREWHSGLGDVGYLLYGLVRVLRPRTIVEIGSARGKSTCYLALACKHNQQGRVYAIDPHGTTSWNDRNYDPSGTYAFLCGQLQRYGLEEWCEVIRGYSDDVLKGWSRSIDLLFIDGDHSLKGVRRDFEGFGQWVERDGFVLFHDSAWARNPNPSDTGHPEIGVPLYLHELQAQGYPSVTVPVGPGLTLLQKSEGGFDFLKAAPNGARPACRQLQGRD